MTWPTWTGAGITYAPRLVRKGLSPAPLYKEGAAHLKCCERLAQSILRADKMVRPVWMLSINGEGDAQVTHSVQSASRLSGVAPSCALRLAVPPLVSLRRLPDHLQE